MDDQDRLVDAAVKRLAGATQPSNADKLHAHAQLSKAIARERRRRAGRRFRLVPVVIVSLILVVGILIVSSLRTTPVRAALEEIAYAVEQVEPHALSDSEFLYLVSDELALTAVPAEMLTDVAYEKPELVYLLMSRREVWYGDQGAVQIRTTNQAVNFFSPHDQAAYFAAGLDETHDQLGEPVTLTVTEEPPPVWPAEPAELDQAIRQAAQGDRIATVEYVDTALDIIRDPRNSPDVHGATFRLLGGLDEIEIIADNPEAVTFAIEYVERGIRHQLEFRLTSEGTLKQESISLLEDDPTLGTAAGTELRRALYHDVVVVHDLS